jgi:hypothetical protein
MVPNESSGVILPTASSQKKKPPLEMMNHFLVRFNRKSPKMNPLLNDHDQKTSASESEQFCLLVGTQRQRIR